MKGLWTSCYFPKHSLFPVLIDDVQHVVIFCYLKHFSYSKLYSCFACLYSFLFPSFSPSLPFFFLFFLFPSLLVFLKSSFCIMRSFKEPTVHPSQNLLRERERERINLKQQKAHLTYISARKRFPSSVCFPCVSIQSPACSCRDKNCELCCRVDSDHDDGPSHSQVSKNQSFSSSSLHQGIRVQKGRNSY